MQKKIVKHLSSTGIKQIEDSLNWQYPYKLAENIPTKTSVSKIKEDKNNIIKKNLPRRLRMIYGFSSTKAKKNIYHAAVATLLRNLIFYSNKSA